MNEHLLERRLNQVGAQLLNFSCRESLAQALCDDLQLSVRAAIAARGTAALVLPGGDTPRRMLSLLSRCAIDWPRLTVTLSDEVWQPGAQRESNAQQLRECLLVGAAAQARFVPLTTAANSAGQCAELVDAELAALPRFDGVVVGMGRDGRCASLYADSPQLSSAMALDSARACVALDTEASPSARLSLTLARLLNCERLVVYICGEEKRHVLERALFADERVAPTVAALFDRGVEVSVYWAP